MTSSWLSRRGASPSPNKSILSIVCGKLQSIMILPNPGKVGALQHVKCHPLMSLFGVQCVTLQCHSHQRVRLQANWAPDSRAQDSSGPNCPGLDCLEPNSPAPNCPGHNLPRAHLVTTSCWQIEPRTFGHPAVGPRIVGPQGTAVLIKTLNIQFSIKGFWARLYKEHLYC